MSRLFTCLWPSSNHLGMSLEVKIAGADCCSKRYDCQTPTQVFQPCKTSSLALLPWHFHSLLLSCKPSYHVKFLSSICNHNILVIRNSKNYAEYHASDLVFGKLEIPFLNIFVGLWVTSSSVNVSPHSVLFTSFSTGMCGLMGLHLLWTDQGHILPSSFESDQTCRIKAGCMYILAVWMWLMVYAC